MLFWSMRSAARCIVAFLCLTPLASATGLDGKWSAEFQSRGKKAKKPVTAATLSLARDGKLVTGTVTQGKKAIPIQEGKLDGSSFSFVTVRKSKKKGESRMQWSGTVDGDQIRGTRSRESGKRVVSFIGKRL